MKETRQVEIRAKQENDEMIITGTPIVFNQKTEIRDKHGSYYEIIDRHALDGVDLNDTRLIINHDNNRIPLARTPKTMQLTVERDCVRMRAILPDTEDGRSVYTAVERGDLKGMSFSFTCDTDGNQYDAETRTRTIKRFRKIYECSIVSDPAYAMTSVEARSMMQDEQQKYEARQELKRMINKIKVGI